MSDSFFNVAVGEGMIEAAKRGRDGAMSALRDFIHDTANAMPQELVIEVAETMLAFRKQEMKDEIERN